jgi:hypothetical protein
MKWVLRLVIALVLLAVVVVLGARWYLSSSRVAEQVRARLEALLGAPVHVGEVNIGLSGSSSVGGLELYESKEKAHAWLKADRLEADVSALKMLAGEAVPHTLQVSGASVTLRFDRRGRFLTRLPGGRQPATILHSNQMPDLTISNSQVAFRREGAAELVVRGITAQVRHEDGQVVLTGQAENPRWGKWSLDGRLTKDGRQVILSLRSAGPVHVTQQMLGELPFLDPGLWQKVRFPKGDTPGQVTLRYDLKAAVLHYEVELEPTDAIVQVPDLDFAAHDTRGKVVIQDGRVKLRDVAGQSFGGTVATDADLDFRSADSHLSMPRIAVKALQLAAMPASWRLPPEITGRLTGTAALDVRWVHLVTPTQPAAAIGLLETSGTGPLLAAAEVVEGRGPAIAITRGTGEGEITDAYVAGQPAAEPIRLELHAVPGGYQFHSPAASGVDQDRGLLRDLPDQPAPAGPVSALAVSLADVAAAGMEQIYREVHACAHGFAGMVPRDLKGRPRRPGQGPPALEVNLHLENVDLAKFARGLKLELPFTLQGRLSFQVQANIPLQTSGDLKTYRANGSATVTNLTLGDLKFAEVRAKVACANGILQLVELQGTLPGPAAGDGRLVRPGTFQGTARMPLAPLGRLVADLTVHGIPLEQVASVAGAAGLVQGRASGEVHAEVPGAQLQTVDAWQATGRLAVKEARVQGADLRDAFCGIGLEKGRLTVAGLRALVNGTPVTGAAELRLHAPYAFGGGVDVALDLGTLSWLAPAWRPPLALAGRLTSKANFHGTVQPFTLDLEAPQLQIQGIPAEKLHGQLHYCQSVLDYRLQGQSLGGTFEINGRYPPARVPKKQGSEGRLQIHRMQLARLLEVLTGQKAPSPLHARLDLDLTFGPQGPKGLLAGQGGLLLSDVVWNRQRWGNVRGNLVMTADQLWLRELTGSLGAGAVRGQVVFDLKDLARSWFTLDLDGVDAADLLGACLHGPGDVRGPLTARVRGTLGRTWHGSADVVLERGQVLGIGVSQWRLPITWEVVPGEGRGKATLRDSSAQVARGRATAAGSVQWGDQTNLDGQVLFRNIDLQTFLRDLGTTTQIASGATSGRLDFAGRDVHSIDDLTGLLEANLGQTQALQLPVLRQLTPFLAVSPNLTFTRGSLRARLARRVVRVEELTLEGSVLRFRAQGTVTFEGRLNLDVTTTTGRLGLDAQHLHLFGIRLPAVGTIPLSVLMDANTFLASRLLQLHVRGTISDPVIQVRPLPVLTQEAVRFFLNRY